MAANRIITYELAENLIARIADYVMHHGSVPGNDITHLAVVFGGERPALFLKKELAHRLGRSYASPHFFTIDSFVDYTLSKVHPWRLVPDMAACYYIYQIAQRLTPDILSHREQFSQFLPWAREIRDFIDQLDMEDIPDKQLRSVQEIAAIGYDVPPPINTMLEHIIAIRGAYHEFLHERGIFSKGLRYKEAATCVNNVQFNEFDSILFCGFSFLNNTQKQIMKSLYDLGKAVLICQGTDTEWSILADVAKVMGQPIRAAALSASKKPAITAHAGFDSHSQVSLVRTIIEKVTRHDNTVIVVPNPDTVIPLISEIAGCCRDFNVSMGYPLKRSSLFALFELLFKAQNTRKQKGYYAKDYLNALRHPLIKNVHQRQSAAVSRVLIHKIEELLLGITSSALGGSLFIRLHEVSTCSELYRSTERTLTHMGYESLRRHDLAEVVGMLHELAFISWENINSFNQFAQTMHAFLDTLVRHSFVTHYPLNISIIKRIYDFIEELQHAEYKDERFEKEEIFKIFLQHLEGLNISFRGSPLKGLQILGQLETRSLNFETVIMMDMNEGVVPRIRRYLPLIPREVMAAIGIRFIEKEEEIQRYHFRRLMASAREVHFIYNAREDKEKSRFIEEVIWEEQCAKQRLSSLPTSHGYYPGEFILRERQVKKSEEVIDYLTNDFEFSASSINTYVDCPLRFYYQYVLRLEEKEDFLEEPEGAYIGDFIHRLLEATFTPFIAERPRINRQFIKLFFKTFDKRFQDEFSKKMKSDSFIVYTVMRYRLERFLEREQERCEQDGAQAVIKIVGLEKPCTRKIRLSNQTVRFTAFIDRIDELKDGSLLVIDYKTGASVVTPVELRRLQTMDVADRQSIKKHVRSFQLPLYLFFVMQERENVPCDAALYYVRDGHLDYYSKKVKEGFPFLESHALCMQALNTMVAEIVNPTVPFVPDKEAQGRCALCPFQALCP